MIQTQRLLKSKSPLSFHPIALIFGLLSFVSYLVEGAVGDWSALYLFEDKGIVIEEAVMGVMLFNGTMCIGRLFGNRLGKHLTSKQVVAGGYLLWLPLRWGLSCSCQVMHPCILTYYWVFH